jgi:hypothetical protein
MKKHLSLGGESFFSELRDFHSKVLGSISLPLPGSPQKHELGAQIDFELRGFTHLIIDSEVLSKEIH